MDRQAQLLELFKVTFPQELLEVWDFAKKLKPEDPRYAFNESLGISLHGPFEVLAGAFDDVTLRYPALLHWRYSYDPAEFFTVMVGDCDGLHWGYWFDAPGSLEPCVVSYYARDAYELHVCADTLFGALRAHLEQRWQGAHEYLNEPCDPEDERWYREDIERLDALRERLCEVAGMRDKRRGDAFFQRHTVLKRQDVQMTSEYMGVVVPGSKYRDLKLPCGPSSYEIWDYVRHTDMTPWIKAAHQAADEGFVGTALWMGRELWGFEQWAEQAAELLVRGYEGLGRELLAHVVKTHARYRWLPSLSILDYKPGDYHSWDEAQAEPECVETLSLNDTTCTQAQLGQLLALPKLRRLSLFNVQVEAWPKELSSLTELVEVQLWDCPVTTFPSLFLSAPALESLSIGRALFKTIPIKKIAAHKSLKTIGLSHNERLPDERIEALRKAAPHLDVHT